MTQQEKSVEIGTTSRGGKPKGAGLLASRFPILRCAHDRFLEALEMRNGRQRLLKSRGASFRPHPHTPVDPMAWILGRRARPLGTRAIPCAGHLYLKGSARGDFNQPIPEIISNVSGGFLVVVLAHRTHGKNKNPGSFFLPWSTAFFETCRRKITQFFNLSLSAARFFPSCLQVRTVRQERRSAKMMRRDDPKSSA